MSGAPKILKCSYCANDATCIGQYECMTEPAPACDECCGHGCEDGHCEPIRAAIPEKGES